MQGRRAFWLDIFWGLCYNQTVIFLLSERTFKMKIYFVRHGHPDYKLDCLTELGHNQAAIAAENLRDSGIEAIYSSTKGRAVQTAEYTAKLLGLPIDQREFMCELGWSSKDETPIVENGHPWKVSRYRVSQNQTLVNVNWREDEPYCRSIIVERAQVVIDGIDAWLAELGFVREGEFYRVSDEIPYKVVAMFSHAGASSAAISHMLNIPMPQFFGAFKINFVSSFVLELNEKHGELIYPKIILLDDVLARSEDNTEVFYGN